MKIIAAYHKSGGISYTSHLDIQRTLQRAFRRANIPLSYSMGFNPHPLISFATALATGYSSDCEWFEVQLSRYMSPAVFEDAVNAVMPQGLWLSQAFEADSTMPSLSSLLKRAGYFVTVSFSSAVDEKALKLCLEQTMAEKEIIITKKTKGGIKPVNIRPQIIAASLVKAEQTVARFEILGELTSSGGLRVEPFVHHMLDRLGVEMLICVHRAAMYFDCDCLP